MCSTKCYSSFFYYFWLSISGATAHRLLMPDSQYVMVYYPTPSEWLLKVSVAINLPLQIGSTVSIALQGGSVWPLGGPYFEDVHTLSTLVHPCCPPRHCQVTPPHGAHQGPSSFFHCGIWYVRGMYWRTSAIFLTIEEALQSLAYSFQNSFQVSKMHGVLHFCIWPRVFLECDNTAVKLKE